MMSKHIRRGLGLAALGLAVAASPDPPAWAADTFNWNTNQNRVTADIKSSSLLAVLEKIATATRWHVFVEPETFHTVSTKFRDLPPGQALSLLLGDVNFILLPGTNTPSRLLVFRTTRQNATRLVPPTKLAETATGPKPIANELIVKLKPGAKIDDLARQLGAKVVGRIDSLNAYRLSFDDAAAANAARDQLTANPGVASVDNNYSIDRPPTPGPVASTTLPPPQLQLKPPPDNGRVVIGLIDTAVQPLGNNLDQFLLKQLSVAGDPQLDPNSPSHGTSMAETILRSLQAVTQGNTSVQILPVDVYGPNPSTSTFDVAAGIVQAVNGGANVLNLSLGSEGDSSFLRSVIQDAIQNKIAIFAAAGNTPVITPFYPAAYSDLGVVAVTAVDQGQIAPYANRGSFVDVGAPGTSVIYFNGQPYYVMGTSASAAFTSGLAAGYMDANHATTARAQSFILSNFGFKPTAGK